MRRLAGTALICSSAFIAIVALLSDAPALFYVGTALLATIATARFQSYLSVRGLQFQRYAPKIARIGEQVKVELVVKSEKNIRRPLVYIKDQLPPGLYVAGRTPSLPIAPDYSYPVRTEYSFRPRRRGIYHWSGIEAVGTDALGLVTTSKNYSTAEVEMTVLPTPLAVSIDLPAAAGWGVSEASSGDQKGPGGEPRGIREYKHGDSLRHVHWRSSARTGVLQVKEFEAGSHSSTTLFFQRTSNTDLLKEPDPRSEAPVFSSLDLMVGHGLHLVENLLRQGAEVSLPQLEGHDSRHSSDRRAEIALLLAGLQANTKQTLSEEIAASADHLPAGSLILAFLVRPDAGLPQMIQRLRSRDIQLVGLLYDADAFVDTSRRKKAIDPARSAGSVEFADALRSAGAYPIQMSAFGGHL